MSPFECLTLGRDLLNEHGLDDWSFEIDNDRKSVGKCDFEKKTIFVSKHWLYQTDDKVKDTILHEIAHAVLPYSWENCHHGEEWRSMAMQIGADPDRITEEMAANKSPEEVKVKQKKHIAPLKKTCPICSEPAIETSRAVFGSVIWTKLKCGHLVKQDSLQGSSPEDLQSVHGYRPYGYQVEGIKFLERSGGRALIADEPGLGKTIQALGFIKLHPECTPVLWVCKNSLKMQAMKESLEWCGIDHFPNTIDSSKSYIFDGMKIYIISMDLIDRLPREKLDRVLGQVKTIVADEVQHFKNPDSKRSQALRYCVNKVDHFIALSGTPWKNRGSEYFTILNLLAPERFPTLAGFQNKWVDYSYDSKEGKVKERGIRNVDDFRAFTSDFIIRRMRDDVLPDLPPVRREIRYVELDELYGENYEKAEGIVAEKIKDILLEGRNLNQLASELMVLKHITGLAKVDAVVEDTTQFLEDTEEEQKITLFYHHIDVGDAIEEKLFEAGYNVLRLRGGEDAIRRNEVVERFKDKPENRILLASTLASGEGLNLQFCQNAVMIERQWNHVNEEQAEFRFSRPLNFQDYPEYLQKHLFDAAGLPKKVSIRIPYMICASTIDEMLTDIVERKRLAFRTSMNEKDKDLKWSDIDTIKELAELIVKKRSKSAVSSIR